MAVSDRALLALVEKLLDFPFPQICRHLVAHDLLQAMREAGAEIPDQLIDAVTQAQDTSAKQQLAELMETDHADDLVPASP